MRFAEFKLTEAEETPGYYTIGDSHAKGIATGGGKPWVNLAIGGTQADNSEVRGNVNSIPKGSIVLVAAGANDTANAAKAATQQRRKPIAPSIIAARVVSLVELVKERQPKKIIFLLFPNGPARTNGIEQWYGGDYQEAVRDAIKSKLDVTIIDLDGRPLADGIHAVWSEYVKIGKDIVSGKIGGTAGKPNQGSNPKGEPLVKIEYPRGTRGPEIADIQKVIKAEGFGSLLGTFGGGDGVDGIRGKYTTNAIATWQKENNLKDTSGVPGKETVDLMNQLLGSKYAGKIIKSTEEDVIVGQPASDYTPQAGPGVRETGNAREAVNFFISKGWSPAQAAGIVGNLQAESGAHLVTNAVGDGGLAYGIAQWHPDRQAKFKKAFGKDIRQAGFKDQLAFVQWELDNSESNAAQQLRKTTTPKDAAVAFDQYYERSSGAHRGKRIAFAQSLSSTAVA